MTGLGTQIDPYIITDVYDFCAIEDGTETEYKYYKLGHDIDFNNHNVYKNGIAEIVVNAPYTVLDGDGKKIRNIVVTGYPNGNPIFGFRKIEKVIFENLINKSASSAETNYVFRMFDKFEECSFYIHLMGVSFYSMIYNTTQFFKCSVTIGGATNSYINFSRSVMTECNIHFANLGVNGLNRVDTQAYSSATRFYNTVLLFSYGNFTNCYFDGKINQISGNYYPSRTQVSDCQYYVFFNGVSFNSCYIAVDYETFQDAEAVLERAIHFCITGNFSTQRTWDTQTGVNFIDKQKFFKNFPIKYTYYSSNSCKMLTTEQSVDPSYISGIGFPVVPVEE